MTILLSGNRDCASWTFLLLLLSSLVSSGNSYVIPLTRRSGCTCSPDSRLDAAASSTTTTTASSTRDALVQQLDAFFAQNKNTAQPPEDLLEQLERLTLYTEPNRSPDFLGEWHVWYTNCPPPSNGQLGPFQGTASQVIQDSSTKSYQNLLRVPPNDWLTATLDGIWEEWDGQLLPAPAATTTTSSSSDNEEEETTTKARQQHAAISSSTKDWGANYWKVTFLGLRINLLGFTVLNQTFPPNTARVWRTTYMDDQVRIVRAGKTGLVQDEYVFYTKRIPAP